MSIGLPEPMIQHDSCLNLWYSSIRTSTNQNKKDEGKEEKEEKNILRQI